MVYSYQSDKTQIEVKFVLVLVLERAFKVGPIALFRWLPIEYSWCLLRAEYMVSECVGSLVLIILSDGVHLCKEKTCNSNFFFIFTM